MTASRSPATRLHRTGAPWWLITAALGTLWCLLSFPFLTSAGVGTGEAYNYSLALADGVQQLRAGEAPVLVGQTEFAFNGRVHPLRNAPYLFYLAGLLDVLTWRHLSFWQLQNLSIALSLALAVLTTWFGLRWSGGCSRITAFGLTALFVFSPALLGAAYSLDLFMTVHAAPFVTLALASALRECRTRSPSNDLLLALALGAAWWAHPPTALWTTAIAAPVRVAAIPDARWLGSLLRFLAAGLSIAALIAYVFVSATEITPYQQLSDHRADFKARFVDVTLTSIDETFPGVVLPVSREAQSLTDVQYGYGLATVLTLSLMAAVARLRTRRALVGPAMMLGAALLLVLLALPVPVLTSWIWRTLPVGVHTLTGAWPSQRLFLVAAAATVVAAAALQPWHRCNTRRARSILAGMAALVVLWTAWQALPFLQRGLNTRWSEEESRRRHLASNVDLTVTSYAFLGLPPTFMHGVMEPWAEFQLIPAYGSAPILSNFDTAVAHGQTVASGDLRWAEDERGNSHTGEATLELHPGTSYVLLFDWAESVEEGTLLISGPTTQRHYSLPNAGERLGFGVSPPHRRGFALSTSHEGVESISLRVHLNAASAAQVSGPRLAQFSLLKVPTEVLPVRLQTLFPLRAEVTAPGEGYYVETPRRFIEGYAALVNGRPVRPVTSPTGQVMIPVPPGLSRVELSFPGSPRLRAVFWSGAASWASLAAFIVIAARWRPHRPMIGQVALVAPAIIFGLVLAIQLRPRDTPAGRALAAPGPLLIELLLPRDKIGAEEVIVASGKPSAGNFISLLYQDPEHVQVRLDVWGSAIASEPVRIDYLQVQELTISAGFLYPADDNETKSLPPWQLHSLRQQVRVELNGKTVIDEPFRTFESAWEDVTFGRSAIGGSLANAQFSGTLAQVRRLVIPTQHWLEDLAAIDVRWPADRWGMQEPLFSVKLAQGLGVLTAQYLHPDSVRLSFHAPDGSVTTSSPVKMALDRTQRLAWATTGADWQISLDGQRVLATQPAPGLESPQLVWLGLNASSVAHVAARFSGVSLRAIERPPPEVPGALQLSLRLPPFQAGAAEPLVITGEAGRADALFITYVDANHVRFGIDHWGVGGHQSPEIAVAYDAVHSIEVMMGSLYPPVGDARWGAVPRAEQEMRKGHVVVRLNGAEVWRLPLATYEVGGAPPAIGVNAIGVSSCAPTFSGQILRAKRSDLR